MVTDRKGNILYSGMAAIVLGKILDFYHIIIVSFPSPYLSSGTNSQIQKNMYANRLPPRRPFPLQQTIPDSNPANASISYIISKKDEHSMNIP